MTFLKDRPALAFGLRAALALGVLLSPLPYLADAYTTVFETFANGALYVIDFDSRYGFRFEAPETIRAKGSWIGNLRVEDRIGHETAHMHLDVRTFCYRPVATLLALAAAGGVEGRRRRWKVILGGLALTVTASSLITMSAALRFGIGKFVGFGAGIANETAYEALTTPAMAYVIPLLCYGLVFWLTRPQLSPAVSQATRSASASSGFPAN